MAIIAIAAYKLVRLTDDKDRRPWAISAVVFAVTALTGQEPISLIIGTGLLMIVLDARPALRWPRREPRRPDGRPPAHGIAAMPVAWAALGTAAAGGMLVSLGLFFLETGTLVFGSGLAIVPLLRDGVKAQHHWLKAFVTGATAAAGGALCGAVVVLTRQAVTDLSTAVIALVCVLSAGAPGWLLSMCCNARGHACWLA
jgi:chromate transporter